MLIFALHIKKLDTVMNEIYKSQKSKVLNLWDTITPNINKASEGLKEVSAEAISSYCFNTYYAQIAFRHIKVNSTYIMLDCAPDIDVFGHPLATLIKKTFAGAIFASSDIDALIEQSFNHLKEWILCYWQATLEVYEAN